MSVHETAALPGTTENEPAWPTHIQRHGEGDLSLSPGR
jgi:hypothetical protein